MNEILTPEQMAQCDAAAIAAGTPGIELMENAGKAVADAARAMLPGDQPRAGILVVCGPGNNGGDGFVAARILAAGGFRVELLLAGEPEALRGDAHIAWERWRDAGGKTLSALPQGPHALIIDALFGAGLARPVRGELAELIARINASEAQVLAVDLPSGIDGATGKALGIAVMAARSITFFRKKPGHLLMPGRSHCGRVDVAQIGIGDDTLDQFDNLPTQNEPKDWLGRLPSLSGDTHKYRRGFALVVSGPIARTGAARLAARAALRIGAGLVSLASPPDALAVNAAQSTAVMPKLMDGANGLAGLLSDERYSSVAIGPGLGTDAGARALVTTALKARRATVLDADALTGFQDEPETLYTSINKLTAPCVMTPHGGEFARLFGWTVTASGKLEKTYEAARLTGAVVVFKGPDTVIAAPDGRAAINANAPPTLATAGSGDVLTGMICGLVAQGMDAFEAACAAVWMHGEAANLFGPGLIAEDIETMLPDVMVDLAAGHAS